MTERSTHAKGAAPPQAKLNQQALEAPVAAMSREPYHLIVQKSLLGAKRL